MKIVPLLVVVSAFLLVGCTREIPFEQGLPIEAHFCERENCTTLLVSLLDHAEDAKCALYDVSQPEVLDALRGVDWVTEDGKSPLMHNKFCVINESMVWTGSWNPTKSTRANNVVIVHSTVLAGNYLREFEELPGGYRRVLYPHMSYNNKLVENYFCPEDDCKEHVLEQLQGARQEIVFMLADITDKDIIETLQRTDIPVTGVIDKAEKEALKALHFAASGSIHHKVFIIDGKTVITGSYNPTRNGNERNDENILIIHDPLVAKKFLEEFEMLT